MQAPAHRPALLMGEKSEWKVLILHFECEGAKVIHKLLTKCTAQRLLPVIHSADQYCQPVYLSLSPQQEQTFQLGVQLACGVFQCLFTPSTQHFQTESLGHMNHCSHQYQTYPSDISTIPNSDYACSCQGAAFSKVSWKNTIWSYTDIIYTII